MTYFAGGEKPSLEDIEHHGVKGMKWGVRRDPTTGARPIAVALNNSRFGQAANANAQRHMARQNAKVQSAQDKQHLQAVKSHKQDIVRQVSQKSHVAHPTTAQIVKARTDVHATSRQVKAAKQQYKVSKAQYRIDKTTIGRTKAKIILEKNGKIPLAKARARHNSVHNVASQETTAEVVNRVIMNVLSG